MKFNIEDYSSRYVMNCRTEEDAIFFLKYLDSIGLRWCSGHSYADTNYTFFHRYKEKIAYNFNTGELATVDWYKERGYAILKFDDFNWDEEDDYDENEISDADILSFIGGSYGTC